MTGKVRRRWLGTLSARVVRVMWLYVTFSSPSALPIFSSLLSTVGSFIFSVHVIVWGALL